MQFDTPHGRFWQWFGNNADRIYDLLYGQDEKARRRASNELNDAVQEAAPELILEICRGEAEEPRQLVVSADGKPERVDVVKAFVAAAPALSGWIVVAFRPRMKIGSSVEIALEGGRVGR